MGNVDLKKLFEKVYEEDHHNLDLLIKIYNDRDLPYWDEEVKRMYHKVLYDCSWSPEEKVRLLKELDIPCYEHKLYVNYDKSSISHIEHVLMFKNESGLKALILMKRMEDNDYKLSDYIAWVFRDINQRVLAHYQSKIIYDRTDIYGPKKELKKLRNILGVAHTGNFTHKDEVSYMKMVLSMIPSDVLHKIINENIDIINCIIKTQKFKFIDEYIDLYKGNISVFLPAAVETGNLDLVKHLISKGAKLDYKYSAGVLNPVEMAVFCNYNHILKYLIECGGSVDNRREHSQLVSPSEMACSLTKGRDNCCYSYMRAHQGVDFNGYHSVCYSRAIASEVPKNAIKRTEVIYTCFENSKNKRELDYTSILITSIFSKDEKYIKIYSDYILENNIDVDLFRILDYFEISNCTDISGMFQYVKDNILPCCANASKKIVEYLNSIISEYHKTWYSKQEAGLEIKHKIKYIDTLLNLVSEEDKKDVILLPYVRNIKDLKVLLKHGFDINQREENGNTILINLFITTMRYGIKDFSDDEYKLFEYLTDVNLKTNNPLIDITACNNEGFNALSMGIKFLHLFDEEKHAKTNNTDIRTKKEKAIVKLVQMLPKECVDIDSVHNMLERRLQYPDIYPNKEPDGLAHEYGKFETYCLYQNHYHLFTELKRKMNFRKEYSQKLINAYFEDLKFFRKYVTNIDYEKTEEFLYSCLDFDTEIQHLDISNIFNGLVNMLKDADYEKYLEMLQGLSESARTLDDFYKQHITKKIAKDKYLEFMANKYDTRYGLNQYYLMRFVLYGIYKFGKDKIDEILLKCPQFDHNAVLNFEVQPNFASIYSSNFEYVDDKGYPHRIKKMYYPKIADKYGWDLCDSKTVMTGTLMSYAILLNDIEFVKKLESLGFEFYPESYDGVDIVWDYVTSDEMKDYLETKVGPQFYADLNADEVEYLTGIRPRSRK